MSTEAPLTGPSQNDLEKALRAELAKQQDVLYAIIGGLAGSLIAAFIWAFISVTTGYQVAYVAIGVGALVGFSVRYIGAGIDPIFGVIGAILALFGCVFGNLLSQLAFAAQQESVGYFEVFGFLNFDVIREVYVTSFSPMDLVFYAIAAYEGYRFAFRDLKPVLQTALTNGKVGPPPYASMRLPAVIVVFVLISGFVFFAANSSTGVRTFYYESGTKRAMGEMSGGREVGPWQLWYENGGIYAEGFYNNGRLDSVWNYYNEDGVLYRSGHYKNGLEEGEWITYNPDSTVADKGEYKHGRQAGPWVFYFPGGKLMSKGSMAIDRRHGEWEDYYENGQLQSKGKFVEGVQTGFFTEWYEDGKKSKESEYADGAEKILNAWEMSGRQFIVDGNGEVKSYDEQGTLIADGQLKNGFNDGKYVAYFSNGKKREEGEYRDNVYYIDKAWNEDGEILVSNGTGPLENFYPDGNRSAWGKMNDGLKMGVWTINYPMSDKVAYEETYKRGKKEGPHTFYSMDGVVKIKGQFAADKREGEWTWYQDDGTVESVVSYVDDKKEGEQLFYGVYGDLLKREVYEGGRLVETVVGL